MKVLYYSSPELQSATLAIDLTARGHQVVSLIGGDPPDHSDACLMMAPVDLDQAVSAVHEIRRLLLPQTPILVLGPWNQPQQVQHLLDAGADDYCLTPAEMLLVEMRLHILCHLHCGTAPDDAASLRQRLLLQTHHSEALVSITHSIGHDFNNLFAAIQGNAELSLLDLKIDGRLRHSLEEIEKAARRAAELTRQVLAFSNNSSTPGEFRPLALSNLIRDMGELLRVSVAGTCRMEQRLGRALPLIAGDAVRLRQLLLALVGELSTALGEAGGTIQIRTSLAELDRPPEVVVEIDATPARVLPDDRFLRFFAVTGAWLDGNHAAAAIVGLHHGHLTLERNASGGARFRISLPTIGVYPPDGRRPDGPSQPEIAGATVLLIDDEESVRVASLRLLRRSGYTVLEAASGDEGLALFEQLGGALDIVVLDLNMPGMESREVIRRIQELRPDQRIVVWSGFSEEAARAHLDGITGISFIEKPAQLSDLPLALGRVLAT